MGIEKVSERGQDRDGLIATFVRSADTICSSYKDTTVLIRSVSPNSFLRLLSTFTSDMILYDLKC